MINGVVLNPSKRGLQKLQENGIYSVDWSLQTIDGILSLRGIPVSRIAEQREKVIIRSDDVFIATYPKCGTTWMQHIVKLIANNGVENGINHDVAIPWIQQMHLEEIERCHLLASLRHIFLIS